MNKVRKAIESLYIGMCNIYEYKEVFDEQTKLSSKQEVITHENIKCKLSYKNSPKSKDAEVTQIIRLLIAPEIEIRPGSKIVVTQSGKTTAFKNTGEPQMFINHQEIELELFERWA